MTRHIKRIKLKNGSVYSIFDNDALRLNEQGILVTGNGVVDRVILAGNLIISIDDIPAEEVIGSILVTDPVTGEIKKRSKDDLLKDIGGTSYKVDSQRGILSLKIGKQDD